MEDRAAEHRATAPATYDTAPSVSACSATPGACAANAPATGGWQKGHPSRVRPENFPMFNAPKDLALRQIHDRS